MRTAQKLDPRLHALWQELCSRYREAAEVVVRLGESATPTQKACSFLAKTTIENADAALLLAEHGSYLPACSLLRICVESQARASRIMSEKRSQQDQEANNFFDLITVSRAYESEQIINANDSNTEDMARILLANRASADPEFETRCRNAIALGKAKLPAGKTLFDYKKILERRWGFSAVYKMVRQSMPMEQRIKHHLEFIGYIWRACCLAAHGSPAALLMRPTLESITLPIFATAFSATHALLLANGDNPKEKLASFNKGFAEYYT